MASLVLLKCPKEEGQRERKKDIFHWLCLAFALLTNDYNTLHDVQLLLFLILKPVTEGKEQIKTESVG